MVRNLLCFALVACAGGCSTGQPIGGPCEKFDTGEEPCRQQLYFPSSAAMDPDGDLLYVTSANADLRYSGGTVAAIDPLRFECAATFFRDGAAPARCAQVHALVTGADGKPESRTLAELAPEDARGCHHDLLDPRIVECDEAPFVVSAVKIGNFGGLVRVQARGADGRRLWLPVRGDPSITFIDVAKPHPADPGDFSSASQVKLGCGDLNAIDPAHQLPSCNRQRITVRDFHDTPSSCSQDADCPGGGACSNGKCAVVPLPSEPFGMRLHEGTYQTANGPAEFHHLLVTHLLTGEVTLINADPALERPVSTEDQPAPEGAQVVFDVHGGFFGGDAASRRGAFDLAPLRPGDVDTLWYLTSRLNPVVELFRINVDDTGHHILPTGGFSVGAGPLLVGDDVRDVAVEPPDVPNADPSRAFLIDNHPPSLLTLDVRLETPGMGPTGLPANAVTDAVPVCQGPSHLGLRRFAEPGGRMATRAYVVCFATGQVAVVDPDLALLVDTILTGRGPNDITFNFGEGVTADPAARRGYVPNFTDSTVAVIDLERGSPTENRVIFRIGTSEPPPSM